MRVGVSKQMLPYAPWGLFGLALVTCVLGLWNLASAARPPHHPVWTSQALFMGVGVVAAICVCLVDLRFIQRMVVPFYVLNIAALLLLRVIGHKANGADSWFIIGPFRLEPAEYMKIAVILMLAKFFHDDYRRDRPTYGFLRLIKPVAIFVVPSVIILVQPDLGTTMMILLSSTTVVLFARVRWTVLATGGAVMLLLTAVIWNDYVRDPSDGHRTFIRHLLKRHQSERIAGWLDPEANLLGSGYHEEQSKIAVGSGGLWGKGWKKGTQTGLFFLPEQHTDFIFSVWAEEHGFVACALLLALYGLLLGLCLAVGFNARDRFGVFVAVGVTAMLFWQIFENIGMVIGLLPVTGITLPLMSYGGSSLVSVMVCLGLLGNISMRRHVF